MKILTSLAGLALAIVSVGGAAEPRQQLATSQPDYATEGPFTVRIQRKAGCCDRKGNAFDVYAPQSQVPPEGGFPLVAWGNGTWASPEKYDFLLRHLASWGFVVVASHDSSAASGDTLQDSVAFGRGLGENADGMLRGRVDARKVAVAGHSQGAGGAMNALMASDAGILTAVAFDLPSQKLCGEGDCNRIPLDMPPGTSVLFMSGAEDEISPPTQGRDTQPPLQSVRAYFDAVPIGLSKAMGALNAADHNDPQGQPGCAPLTFGCKRGAQAYAGYLAAWMAWQLQGSVSAAGYFRESSGRMARDPDWEHVASNVRD
jgi:hypothetical protein